MNLKEHAQNFLSLAASGKVQEAYDTYVASNFVHHNQYFKGDRESLLNAMAEAHRTSPNRGFEVKKILADGNEVMTYSRVIRANPKDPEIAVVHIFRFENGKIVELWDAGQLIDQNSPNQNGAF